MVYADTNINTISCQRESGKDNKMVVIASGRFRNQMFQYAVAAIIAKKNKTKVLLMIRYLTKEKNWVIIQEILSF
jgi:hypothetical protein